MVDRNTTRKPHTFKAKTPLTLEPLKKKCVCDAILSLSARQVRLGRSLQGDVDADRWKIISGCLLVDGHMLAQLDEKDEQPRICPRDAEFGRDVECGHQNMTDMPVLNDAEIARNLYTRYTSKICYTQCGPTLVALNLMEDKSESTYGDEQLALYKAVEEVQEAEPHVWSMTKVAFSNLFKEDFPSRQSIVITGESGAGKSFSTKKVLDFVAALAPGEEKLPKRMLETTPLLEAYGNSVMPRNDDSSRFGKLYKVYFGHQSRMITGCEIEEYLLEKSRVTMQAPGERNFHIFYQMMAGLSLEEKGALYLKNCEDHLYLKGGRAGMQADYERIYASNELYEDDIKMQQTRAAFSQFFSEEEVENVLRITAGVILLGDVNLVGDGGEGSRCIEDEAIEAVAELWKMDKSLLMQACHCLSFRMNEPKPLPLHKAYKFRDSMARYVYRNLFTWIVQRCSETLRGDIIEEEDKCLQVLDIFGFECVPAPDLDPESGKVNSLEQFCINLCNELLQKQFVTIVIDSEQAVYKEQLGRSIDLPLNDNQSTIDLLQAEKGSIISSLTDITTWGALDDHLNPSEQTASLPMPAHLEVATPEKSEKATGLSKANVMFFSQIATMEHDRLDIEDEGRYAGAGFRIKHYADEVTYDVRDWVEKNADRISRDISECLASSSAMTWLEAAAPSPQKAAPNVRSRSGSERAKEGVVAAFRTKLATLQEVLSAGDCAFIRCIKANSLKAAANFETTLVLRQLQHTGMLATLKIRRAGYSVRLETQDFHSKFAKFGRDILPKGSTVHMLVEYLNKEVCHVTVACLFSASDF